MNQKRSVIPTFILPPILSFVLLHRFPNCRVKHAWLNAYSQPFFSYILGTDSTDIMIKMLAELLVRGKCVSDGRTKGWL